MPPFRQDNTDGYSDEQLAELNRRWADAGGEGLDEYDDSADWKALRAQILGEYDSEQSIKDPVIAAVVREHARRKIYQVAYQLAALKRELWPQEQKDEAGCGRGDRRDDVDAGGGMGTSQDQTKPPDCDCGKPGAPDHPCPFREDVNNDSETLCNCCDECTYQCAMDI